MPLTNPRFAGDPVLEACLAGTHRMMAPETGPAVRKVQQALIDLGHALPTHGADGTFGDETGVAVTAYKIAHQLSPSDPVVGPGTMAALDTDPGYAAPSPGPTAADLERAEALVAKARDTLVELSELLAELHTGLRRSG